MSKHERRWGEGTDIGVDVVAGGRPQSVAASGTEPDRPIIDFGDVRPPHCAASDQRGFLSYLLRYLPCSEAPASVRV